MTDTDLGAELPTLLAPSDTLPRDLPKVSKWMAKLVDVLGRHRCTRASVCVCVWVPACLPVCLSVCLSLRLFVSLCPSTHPDATRVLKLSTMGVSGD